MKKYKKIIIIISVLIFIISIIPLIHIGFYNHPCADDYSFGQITYNTWKDTHSFIEVLKSSIKEVKSMYNGWQGTFSAIFLMSLQPAIFGEKFYFLNTIILIGTFTIANLYIFKIILKEYLKSENTVLNYIISLLVITFSLQFIPSPVQSLYWYNGSIYYTFFYSIMLILIGNILKLLKTENTRKQIKYLIISIILSITIGGSNYTTALTTNIIIVTILLIDVFIKKDKSRKSIYIAIILLFCLVSLLISAKAPGNSVRQSQYEKSTIIDSIINSFLSATVFIKEVTNKSMIWLYVFLIPLLFKVVKESNYEFKRPILFTIFTFCVYSAQFTPPIYAMKNFIPLRLLNIIYYATYIFIIMNIVYWLGYMKNKVNITTKKSDYIVIYSIIILLGIGILSLEYKQMSSYIAIKSIISGEAKQYDEEMKNRIQLYNNEELKDVEVEKLTVKPYLLFFDDITTNENDWRNVALSRYYKKNSVKIKE